MASTSLTMRLCAYQSSGTRRLALFASSAFLVTAFPNANADGALDVVVGKIIKQIIKDDQCAHEYVEARRIHYFDLDSNGSKDAVVLMTIEGHVCSNNYGFYMAAFRNEGKAYHLIDHRAIGSSWGAHPDFEKVTYSNGQIVLQVKEHAENDAACCPSQERKAIYAIQNGKLVEAKGKKNEP